MLLQKKIEAFPEVSTPTGLEETIVIILIIITSGGDIPIVILAFSFSPMEIWGKPFMLFQMMKSSWFIAAIQMNYSMPRIYGMWQLG
jgi:hypothetical protein